MPVAEFVLAAMLRREKKVDETRLCAQTHWTKSKIILQRWSAFAACAMTAMGPRADALLNEGERI